MKDFLTALKERRSFYAIDKTAPVSDARIEELVGQAVLHTPSAFNMQSARVVVLFGKQHDKLWDIVLETLRRVVPADKFGPTEEKVASFAAGHGTVLYFEDTDVTDEYAKNFPLYRDNFPVWAQQSSGMLQGNLWTMLEQEGLGASLQHYNPLIDAEVAGTWGLPTTWKLIAQMPFGAPVHEPDAKEFDELSTRVRYFH